MAHGYRKRGVDTEVRAYVFIDVSRKQEYIFRNKNLRNNLVNSYVIKAITEIPDHDADLLRPDGLKGKQARVLLKEFLESGYPGRYNVIYSGGGNSIIQFEDAEQAGAFIKGYSLAVLQAYPHLELYISKVKENELSVDEKAHDVKIIRHLLIQRADKLKDKRRVMFRRWSYGIEKLDESGKPVAWGERLRSSALDADRERLNQEQMKDLLLARKMLFSRLEDRLKENGGQEKVKVSVELSSYKANNESKSYIGVIAIDGNKMGELFGKLSSAEDLRAFSQAIEQLYADAVADTLYHYAASRSAPLLVTPVLMSGDDICLVTQAEDALDIAEKILLRIREYSLQAKGALGQALGAAGEQAYLTACAGVAIVKVAYPFFDAIQIAERLCRQAKEGLYRTAEGVALSASFMDWEIVQGQVRAENLYESLTVRARELNHYRIRPLRVDQEKAFDNGVYSYRAFRQLVDAVRELLDRDSDEGEKVSSTFLEKIKKQLYEGWESYRLLFMLDQTGSAAALSRLVESIFCPDGQANGTDPDQGGLRQQHAAFIQKNGIKQRDEYHYILNDVLEALVFIASEKEAVPAHDNQ